MKVLTDADSGAGRNMLANAAPPKVIDVDAASLATKVQAILGELEGALGSANEAMQKFKVSEVSFNLAITSSGEVSLMSILKANTSIQAGIQVKIQPKDPPKE